MSESPQVSFRIQARNGSIVGTATLGGEQMCARCAADSSGVVFTHPSGFLGWADAQLDAA